MHYYIVYPNLNPYHHLQTLPKQKSMEPKYQEPGVLGESLESRDHIDLHVVCKNSHTRKPLTSTGGMVETTARLTPTWAPVYNNEEYC